VSETGLYLPEVDQQEVKPESDISDKVPVANMTRVFVLSYKNKPLMPCSPRKARLLLKEGKANVVKARPFFTIKLTYNTGGAKQDIDLNVDTGYEYIGFALVGIYCYLLGQLKLDNKMTQRLADRAMYRHNRRHRLRYRPARWQNRKKKDLPPSVQRRIDRHIWLIERLQSICPVTNINLETAQFDIQKINNPAIQGEEYQQGNLWRSNVRAYLFVRENSICQYCGKKIKQGERVEIHHIVQRSNGGTDKPDNLALLHDKCHAELHEKGDVKLKKNKQYKGETFMNVLRKRLLAYFPNAIECFGYETQSKRKQLKLEKTHCNDAFAISGVTEVLPNPVFLVEHRKNNRSLQVQKPHKQIAIRRKRYSIQPNDLAWIEHKRYVSKGSTGYGKQVWIMKDGKKQQISAKKIEKVYHFGTIGIEP
jgi:5-methylcytosine-specific restriction endonuclease McrA